MKRFRSLFALSIPLCAFTAVAGPVDFSVDDAPAWTDTVPLPDPGQVSPGDGYEVLLHDEQVRVGPGPLQRFRRRAWRMVDASGVQSFSHLQFDFDPNYERLHLHGVWLIRDGKRRQMVRKGAVKLIQPESELSDGIYTGTHSAVVFLEDVRVGDIIEDAWTIEGNNPVFAGHVTIYIDLGRSIPLRKVRTRVLAPKDRHLEFRISTGGAPAIRSAGPLTEYLYEVTDTERIPYEDRVPGDVEVYPFLEVTDFRSWAEVARWAASTFEVVDGPTPLLDAEIARIRTAHPTDEARFLEALRFVQDDVRYVGIELGVNSHRPHPPDEVLRNRYGDCKDKSLLLVSLLRGLGIEAWPALVNTGLRRGLDAQLPSSGLFDHVIAKARVNGRDLWVDATSTLQRGPIAERVPPPFERALIVDPATTALETIPPATWPGPMTTVEEHYRVDAREGPAVLTVETRSVGPAANRERGRIGSTQREELERQFLNFYAKTFPKIALEKPLEVVDDEATNELLVRETYRIPDFWSEQTEKSFYADTIDDWVKPPEITRRTRPIALRAPLHVLHRIVVDMPEPITASNRSQTFEGPGVRFHLEYRNHQRRLELEYELEHTASRVEVDQVPRYVEALRSIRDELGYYISTPAPAKRPHSQPADEFWGGVFVLLAVGSLIIGGVIWRVAGRAANPLGPTQQRRREFARKFDGTSAGETPATAVHFESLQASRAHLEGLRCQCGAARSPVVRESDLVLAGKRLRASAWTCERCGHDNHFYFSIAELARSA